MSEPPPPPKLTAEHRRLRAAAKYRENWKRWGPYLSERQWGTVREDYSAGGDAWADFTHEQARSRVYRWGEDGLLGVTDRQCRLCFAVALWNGKDPILKERLFGLTGPEGNHGEDVKESYYYLDSTPTHSYMRGLYRYPQAEFPYTRLVAENRKSGLKDPEFELEDTGVFAENRWFDVQVEYAKAAPDDLLARITLTNRGPEPADLWVLPTFWFRNTWIWGCKHEGCSLKPRMELVGDEGSRRVATQHESLGQFTLDFGDHPDGDASPILFTENETNSLKLFGTEAYTPYVKDAFHRYLVGGELEAVNPAQRGTKCAALYRLTIPAGGKRVVRARMAPTADAAPITDSTGPFGRPFTDTMRRRKTDADDFYETVIPQRAGERQQMVSRQAMAGLLWTKQFYHYIIDDWLEGDRDVADPPQARKQGRNKRWRHVYARDVLSMPDKWEYPWFAAWDLAFHMLPMARVDPAFAKKQLLTLLQEWYMHPNGQLPAYEYALGDVNPPVHAWACYRVYQMTGEPGKRDRVFLAKAFQRLLLNFTWWVNQIDENGDNVFAGGFLGLDNIGIFDRSKGLPQGARLEQADGTAWMAFYCGTMLSIALELAREEEAYGEMASKFLDHFVRITDAINTLDDDGLWDEADGFYYDHLLTGGDSAALKIRSLVGLIPLLAVEILDQDLIDRLPTFRRKLNWFLNYRHDLARHISFAECEERGQRMLLAVPTREKLLRVLSVMLDEGEMLSPFGVRSLSKRHAEEPFELMIHGQMHSVSYVPGESDSWLFGGNSNWRGPVWFPINYLLIEALERYHSYYGDSFKVECPTGSGNLMTLAEVARELNLRLVKLFLPCESGAPAPCFGGVRPSVSITGDEPRLLFYEYFHGDSGKGLGASHQTGWTALVANCIEKLVASD